MTMTTSRPRLIVDKDRCEGHALCVQTAPDIFDIGDDDMAIWVEYPPERYREVDPCSHRRLPPSGDQHLRFALKPVGYEVGEGDTPSATSNSAGFRAAGLLDVYDFDT